MFTSKFVFLLFDSSELRTLSILLFTLSFSFLPWKVGANTLIWPFSEINDLEYWALQCQALVPSYHYNVF